MPAPAHSKLSQEQCIALAITDVRSGKCSGRAAAKLHSVPPSTLNDRLHGVPTRSESHSDQFRLSAAQEKVLVDWCHFLDLTAHPLNRQTIYPKVKALCGETPGHNWLDRFLQRHKLDLFTGKTAGLDPKRPRAFNYATIQDYFQKLKAVIDEKKIPWHNIYNMDERAFSWEDLMDSIATPFPISFDDSQLALTPGVEFSSSALSLTTPARVTGDYWTDLHTVSHESPESSASFSAPNSTSLAGVYNNHWPILPLVT